VAPDFRRTHLHYRVGFLLIAAMVVGLLITLPFAIQNVVDDLVASPAAAIYPLPLAPASPAPTYSQLHVAIVSLDELHLRATLRVSGHHTCMSPCPWADAIILFPLNTDGAATAGMLPSARVDLPAASQVITQTPDLPIAGYPNRYPFDVYTLQLGASMARVLPEGALQALSRDATVEHLIVTIQEQLARQEMQPPRPLDAAAADAAEGQNAPYQFVVVEELTFVRPLQSVSWRCCWSCSLAQRRRLRCSCGRWMSWSSTRAASCWASGGCGRSCYPATRRI
jgi:hypothetical protein